MNPLLHICILWTFCALYGAWAKDIPVATEDTAPADELVLTTERVIVFKDGYCLVVKRGMAMANAAGDVYTEQVPNAVLGSFWALPVKDRLISMDAGFVTTTGTTTGKVACVDHLALIQANQGKVATVVMNGNDTYVGTIISTLITKSEQPTPTNGSALGMHSTLSSSLNNGTFPYTMSGTLFVMQTEAGDVVLPVGQIRTMTIKGMAIATERTTTTSKTGKRLTFHFETGGQKKKEMLLMYFTPGLRWIPTYRVTLAAEDAVKKEANIAFQAELLNEVEDLDGVPLDLVVGVPNFRFKNVVSPFSLEAGLRNALEHSAPQLMNQVMFNSQISRADFQQRDQQEGRPQAPALQLPPELSASGAQDLFVYHLPKLKLAKGHRAAVPIFDAVVPYRDIYTWEVGVQRYDMETAPNSGNGVSPLILSENQVWHQIILDNTTRVPWTTGAAMILQGMQPLAQDLMTYTAAGDSVRIPITIAVDARGNFTEQETSREMKPIYFDTLNYMRIDKEASLTLRNSKKIPITVDITCHMGGAADEATHDGKLTLTPFVDKDWRNYRGNEAVNNHSVLTWHVQVDPGQAFSPTVKYHYFARN